MMLRVLQLAVATILLGGLVGCTTYHQPRYAGDGVYFDEWHAVPRQVVVVDPMLYPFWSVDFFYFNHFYRPYRPPFIYDPWLRYRYGWGTRVVWAHPVVYTAPGQVDQRLILLQQDRTPPRQASRTAWSNPGSEVQLRHRLAEDRAAAAQRVVAGGGHAHSSPRHRADRVPPGGAARGSRSNDTRSTASGRSAPAHRPSTTQRGHDHRGHGGAQRAAAPVRDSSVRDRQRER